MSASHHGNSGPEKRTSEQDEVLKRLLDQFEGRARRAYSEGRLHKDDEGDLAMAITADHQNGVVILDFGKRVKWLGLPPDQAVRLAESLIASARQVAKEPLTVNITGST